ncbi:hypothetical protein GE09DRAFT_1055859 [Coniochaeta sp. 2T2.1]|nr:hypothetical protein GE09DRAFT_1055859 [Coniochaeta sp. 2T2.1]
MSKPSIFRPLNPAANEIRLLKLLPGKTGDPVSCMLDVFSLDDSPKYDALSYVCGDPADTRRILVNGLSHNVTVNLESALRGLRRHGKSRTSAMERYLNEAKKLGVGLAHAPPLFVWANMKVSSDKLITEANAMIEEAFPPDYTKPVERVMHDTALFQAGTPAGLDLLMRGHALYENRLSTAGLTLGQPPSWVPDLTRDWGTRRPDDSAPSQMLPQSALFWGTSNLSERVSEACSARCIETASNGRVLRLRVRKEGDYQCLVRFSDQEHDVLNQLSETLARCMHLPTIDVYWRELICDTARLDLGERLVHALIATSLSILSVSSAEALLSGLHRLQAAVGEAERGTDRADKSFLRPMHLWTRKQLGNDDELWFEDSDEYEYKLVGHAYVDGLMDNEYEDLELVARILDQDQQTFYVS